MLYDYVCAKCQKPFSSPKKGKKYCCHGCFTRRFDPVTKTCETCGKQFTVAYRFRGQKTCNLECARSAISKTLTTRATVTCLACGKPFEAVQSYKDNAKYCCYDPCFLSTRKSRQPDVTKTCEFCKQEFTVPFTKNDQRFCDRSCASSGENNAFFGLTGSLHPTHGLPRWNAGLTAKTDPRVRALSEKLSIIMADKMVSGSWSPPSTGFRGEHYVGTKNGGATAYLRSSYESMFARMLDADPSVKRWEHEPMRIPYVFEGSVHNYVPDFLVTYADDSQLLVEVKPEVLAVVPKNAAKIASVTAWCEANGIGFWTVCESELRGDVSLRPVDGSDTYRP